MRYIKVIKDTYDRFVTSMRTVGGSTEEFSIRIGLHQGSALSPYLFTIVMDELTREIQGGVLWHILFADDIVLIDESREGVNLKLELWRQTLESKGFKLSRTKTEYMHCRFSNLRAQSDKVSLNSVDIGASRKFRYLESIVQMRRRYR